MKSGIPKISVVVISYKQKDVIRRALDSLLRQKDYLYEICVSDDCSPDRTWEVLNQYKDAFPDIIKLNRNDPNLGIFANFEKVWTMATGDVVYTLAGDDECPDGWFRKVVEYIQENNIDYKNELFCIYGDYKCVYPNGDSCVHSNKAITTGIDPLRLALRQHIVNRSSCYSINVLKKFDTVSQGRSHIVENVQDRLLQLYAEKSYYIPYVGNVYFSSIGVSVHMNDEVKAEREKIWPFTMHWFQEHGAPFCTKDVHYAEYRIALQKYIHWGNKRELLKAFCKCIQSTDMEMLLKCSTIKNLAFAIRRRLPHKRVINFK